MFPTAPDPLNLLWFVIPIAGLLIYITVALILKFRNEGGR